MADTPGRSVASSAGLGWRLVRADAHHDPAVLDEFTAGASPDLFLVLVTGGFYTIASRRGTGWRETQYAPGSVGVTAPGRRSVFRWRAAGPARLASLHVRLPPAAVHATLDEFGVPHDDVARLDTLSLGDPYVSASLTALGGALTARAAGLYADAVAESVLAHLTYRTLAARAQRARIARHPGALSRRDVDRVLDHMRAHLAEDVGLDTLAGLVSMSKYHFLRSFTKATGETPHRHLVRIRLQRAAHLLRTTGSSVQHVAMLCGYQSASRFAAAFRKQYGLPPAEYRS